VTEYEKRVQNVKSCYMYGLVEFAHLIENALGGLLYIILNKCLGVEHHTAVTSHSVPLTFSLDLLSMCYALHAFVVTYVHVCTQMHAAYMHACMLPTCMLRIGDHGKHVYHFHALPNSHSLPRNIMPCQG
jgi:hypothetical protein